MRPPADGWPETRGSRLGAEEERERARQRMGKTRNQKRAERSNRKARVQRRKHQQRIDEAARSKPIMEQQSLPETKKRKRSGRPLHPELRSRYVSVYDAHGIDELAAHWVEHGYWSRASGDRLSAAKKLLGYHRADAKASSWAPVLDDIDRLVVAFEQIDSEARTANRMNAIRDLFRREPVQPGADVIAMKVGFRAADIRSCLADLVKSGEIVSEGTTRDRRYRRYRWCAGLRPEQASKAGSVTTSIEHHDDAPVSKYEQLLELQRETNQLLMSVLANGMRPAEGPPGPSSFTMPSRPQFKADETDAPVVEMSTELEERITKFVQDEVLRRGGHGIMGREDEKSSLFSIVWSELDEAMYRECGVDPGAKSRRQRGKTRIDVCRDLGMVGDLHKLAFRMFGPGSKMEPAGAKGTAR